MNRIKMMMSIAAVLLLAACNDAKEIKEPVSEKVLYSHVGEEIPMNTAMEWIDYYKKESTANGRTLLPGFTVSADAMKAMLNSVSGLVGVAFHYGIDEQGVSHIIAIPISDNMELWPGNAERVLIDANTGGPINADQAWAWMQNYRSANRDGIWYHFFGKTVFDQMRALPYFDSVYISRGVHTLELTPEMLLIVWNETLSILGRTQDDPGTAYDASNPCPPCAFEDPDKP